MHPFVYAVHQSVLRDDLIDFDAPILVGFSTGPDSEFLYHYLNHVYRPDLLHLVYVNHHLRPEAELAHELSRVTALGQRHPVHSVDAPITGASSIEVRARDARYAHFHRLATQHGITQISTGHHYDDHIETILLQLIRGTQRGLRGITQIKNWGPGVLIRPLIHCYKADILAYLDAQKLPYTCDSTNTDTHFTRNKIRHTLLPLLQSLNPKIHDRLNTFATYHERVHDFLDQHHTDAYAQIIKQHQHCQIDRHYLIQQPGITQSYLLLHMVQHVTNTPANHQHIQTILDLANTPPFPKYTQLPGHVDVTIQTETLSLKRTR